jgi:hypothetical protein
MDSGFCHENDDNMVKPAEEVCTRKSRNSCINDFYCQWKSNFESCVVHPCRSKNKSDCTSGIVNCMWDSSQGCCDAAIEAKTNEDMSTLSFRH